VHPDKAALRREFLDRRRALTAEAIAHARAAVRTAVLQRFETAGWRRVAAYVPLRTEPGSTDLLDGLRARGVEVLVPVLRDDRDLDWAAWPGGAPIGMDAVRTVDALLVPAVAVARDGTRLGRGGGSYDRALARVPAGVPVAALVYDEEVVDALPADPWDVRVGAVVTPGGGWQDLQRSRLDGE
jgi:5-formyltetrahydrofolate cyclo-ligase